MGEEIAFQWGWVKSQAEEKRALLMNHFGDSLQLMNRMTTQKTWKFTNRNSSARKFYCIIESASQTDIDVDVSLHVKKT